MSGNLGVIIGEHAQLRIERLQRGMHHIARDQSIRARLAHLNTEVIDCVAGRGDQLNQVIEPMIAFDDFSLFGL